MNMQQKAGVLAAVVVLLGCAGCESGVGERAALEARIAQLESTVDDLQRMVIRQQFRDKSIPEVVKARAFHVVGENGEVLVKLDAIGDDQTGVVGTVTTFVDTGQEVIRLTATADNEGMVVTFDGKGQELVRLSVTEGTFGSVTTFDATGQRLARFGATVDGDGAVTTFNSKGQELVDLGVTVDGEGTVTTFNGKGQDLVTLGVTKGGNGMVMVFDPSRTLGTKTLAPQ